MMISCLLLLFACSVIAAVVYAAVKDWFMCTVFLTVIGVMLFTAVMSLLESYALSLLSY